MLLINILNIIFIIFIFLHFINKNHFIENLENTVSPENTASPENTDTTDRSIQQIWEDLYKKYLLFENNIKYYISDKNKKRFQDARDQKLNKLTEDSNASAKKAANTSTK